MFRGCAEYQEICSLSGKTTYRKMSRNMNGTRYRSIIVQYFRYLTSISALVVPRCLLPFKIVSLYYLTRGWEALWDLAEKNVQTLKWAARGSKAHILIIIHTNNTSSSCPFLHASTGQLCSFDNQNTLFIMYAWWRHQMESYSAPLASCAGNSPVTAEFPSQRPVTRSIDIFFDLHLEKTVE